MPDELASQLPILKDILKAMNIKIVEKEGYEADDILGTFAKWGEENSLDVTILTGDRDAFQLVSDKITVRIPRTKMGKTEVEDYTPQKILEEYKIVPIDLIEVKGLMGDSSDNIPGVPGVGEKTALTLIQEYKTIDELYSNIDKINGKLKEKLIENKELAYLSKELGTIDTNVPVSKDLADVEIIDWDYEQVLEIFKKLKFNKFIDKFNLGRDSEKHEPVDFKVECEKIEDNSKLKLITDSIKKDKIMYYYLGTANVDISEPQAGILTKKIKSISIYIPSEDKAYYTTNVSEFYDLFEDDNILKCGYKQKKDYILLMENKVEPRNLMFDVEIAGYILNSNINKYSVEYLANAYLGINIEEYFAGLGVEEKKTEQINLFDNPTSNSNVSEEIDIKNCVYAYAVNKLYDALTERMKEIDSYDLFEEVEMPLAEVLANMQYNGIYIEKNELIGYGKNLQEKIQQLTEEIISLTGEEFNINSTKQLGEILFEKLRTTCW